MAKLGRIPVYFSASVILVALLAASAAAQSVENHQHRFSDAEKWAKIFDDPARDAWQKPQEVINALALAPDAAVAHPFVVRAGQ